MNRHEKLGEYIIKNLLFSFILAIIVLIVFSNILMPRIKVLKEKQADYQRVESVYQNILNTNQGIIDQIKQKKEQKILVFLDKNISEKYIQGIAKDFFKDINVKKIAQELVPNAQFAKVTYTLTAKSTSTKDIFDFAKKLQQMIPAATISLPFKIKKINLLKNILDIELTIKVIQNKSFFEKNRSITPPPQPKKPITQPQTTKKKIQNDPTHLKPTPSSKN